MSVLNREALEASPLADLHEIASGLEIAGYRRLRKADLIDQLLGEKSDAPAAATPRKREPRSEGERSGGRSNDRGRDRDPDREPRRRERSGAASSRSTEAREPRRRERAGAAAEGREPAARRGRASESGKAAAETTLGALTVQESGAGFVTPKDGSEQIYVSAAQIRRLELSDGDVIGGPVRPARRSEKHPSLVRVESINGKNADEVAPPVPGKEGAAPRPKATLPTERFALGADATLAQIEKVAPIGRGSRVVLYGGPHSGKSTAARLLGAALKASGAQVFTALAGVREEEQADWASFEPVATETIDSSPDNRAKAVERALDKARRASGNGHAVLIVDSADDLPGASVRKTLGAAQFLPGTGSLTVIVVAKAPLGGETTVVGFDQALAATGKFPSIKVRASSTLRPDLLIDARSLRALHKAHSDAVKKDK
jgi:transcription termination factor Rho